MTPETEVISCPACKHLVRVPADWLGTTVQCPECRAKFTAPVRDGDHLTDPVLLSAPPANPAPARPKADPFLLLPAWGLMLVGLAAVVADGVLFVRFVAAPDGGRGWLRDQMPEIARMGLAPTPPGETEDQRREREEQAVEALAPRLRWVWLAAAAAGGLTAAGGLAIVRRRNYRLAQLGCVAAAVNAPNLCCLPGAVFGLWGLLMLMGDEGRSHFVGAGASG